MIRTVVFFLLTPALALADFAEDFQKTRSTKDHAAMVKLLAATPGTEFLWTGNAALPGPVDEVLPEAIQGYTAPLFREETEEADALCKELLDATVATFPEHPYAYNLLAALADAKGDKDGSYRFLKLAAEKAPEDTLVLSNLADAHRARGKKAEAIAVYEKIIKLEPDGEAAAAAKEALEEVGEEKK